MKTILFYWMLTTGAIQPTEKNDGVQMYSLEKNSVKIELAYKEEIINFLETGSFEYNEDLTFKN
jgi:hypothetical protein